MKRKELTLFVMLSILEICIYGSHSLKMHNIQRQGVWVRNTGPRFPSDSNYNSGRYMNQNLMTKIGKVLKDTLIALNTYNSKLAHYFVQHHPTLTNLYNKINTKSNIKPTTTTVRPILSRKKDIHAAISGKAKPLFVRLSEFQSSLPKRKQGASMQVDNISAGSMSASEVTSDIVRAGNIAADTVVVTGSSNTNNYPPPIGFNSNNQRRRPETFSSSSSQLDRRNYFPPRTNALNNRHVPSVMNFRNYPTNSREANTELNRENPPQLNKRQDVLHLRQPATSMSHRQLKFPFSSLKSNQQETFNREQRVTNRALKVEDSFWDDDWSDFSDSDDDYYDEDVDETNNKPSVISGTEINAGAIQAGSMVADSVMAEQINVRRIIADDVDVSASYQT